MTYLGYRGGVSICIVCTQPWGESSCPGSCAKYFSSHVMLFVLRDATKSTQHIRGKCIPPEQSKLPLQKLYWGKETQVMGWGRLYSGGGNFEVVSTCSLLYMHFVCFRASRRLSLAEAIIFLLSFQFSFINIFYGGGKREMPTASLSFLRAAIT